MLDRLATVKPIELKTLNGTFTDVYVINPIDNFGRKNRNDYVTKLYWSKSQGLVRFDKSDSEYWELIKKYGP